MFYLLIWKIDTDSQTYLRMINNSFTNDSADYLGGAIYWNYYNPIDVINQTYISNNAGVYGND